MNQDWRNESGLKCITTYKKRFSVFPTRCADGTLLWMKYYYVKYNTWNSRYNYDGSNGHREKIEIIDEETYMMRKLAEGF